MDAKQIIADLAAVMTQSAIAEAVGVSQSQVSRWISGDRARVSYEAGERILELRRKHSRAIAKAKRQ
jgi:predicted transcriptional regulator